MEISERNSQEFRSIYLIMKKFILIFFTNCIFLFLNAQTALPPDSLLSETPAGFKYIKHTEEKGARPQPGQVVLFHAQMRNGNAIHFSSRKNGSTPVIEIPESKEDKEWTLPTVQLLLNMAKGDSATTFLRIDTLKTKPRGLENTDWIAYDLVCVDILEKSVWEERQALELLSLSSINPLMDSLITAYKSKKIREQMPLQKTRSGLQYLILKDGSGNYPNEGKQIAVHYAAYLRHGRMVDNSIERKEPFWFPLGQGRVIEGWDEGIALLREGSEAVFFIPSRLAYGEKGALPAVPPHSEMVYFIKLLKVE